MAIFILLIASSSILAIYHFQKNANKLDYIATENLRAIQKSSTLNSAIIKLSNVIDHTVENISKKNYEENRNEYRNLWKNIYNLAHDFEDPNKSTINENFGTLIGNVDSALTQLDSAARNLLLLKQIGTDLHATRSAYLQSLVEHLSKAADRTDQNVQEATRVARGAPPLTSGTIDALVDAHLVSFRSILRLKIALSEIDSIMGRLQILDTTSDIKSAEKQFHSLLGTVNGLLSLLEERLPGAEVLSVAQTVQEWGNGPDSMFLLRSRLIAADHQMALASANAARWLTELQSATNAYYTGILSRTDTEIEELQATVDRNLASVLVMLGLSILLALLIARRLVFQGIVIPLQGIEGAINAVAAGQTDGLPQPTRTEELSRIVMALETLKGHVRRVLAAETEARRQEVLFKSLLDASPDGTLIVDSEGKIIIANDRAEILFKASRQQLIGESVDILVPDDKRQFHKANRENFIAQSSVREMGANLDLMARRLDGSLFPVEISLSPIETETGKIVFASIRDITARKEAEHALWESQRASSLLREALDTFNDSVILYDKDERVIFTNEAYHRIYPAAPSREQITGRSMEDLLRSSLDAGHIDAEKARSDPEGWLEDTLRSRRDINGGTSETAHRNGRTYFIRWSRTIDGGTLLVHYDITALKQLEKELTQAKITAEEAANAKANFLATMSHEIRTPMNGIVTMANILDGTRLTPDQHEMTRTIRQSSEALLIIINDILDISKIEAGKLSIERVHFDLLEQIEGVMDLIAPRAEAGSLLFLTDLDHVLPATVTGDPTRLRQVLLNLIGNAVKFTQEGFIALRVRHIPVDSSGSRIRFEVEDSGIGMNAQQMSGLFKAFSQADSSTARKFGGTGLGLSISKQLVEMMGGEIGVTSVPGQGSTFWFELPFDLVGDEFIRPDDDLSAARVMLAGHASQEAAALEKVLRLGGVTRIDWFQDLESIPQPADDNRYDLVILNGRSGIPSVIEWGKTVPAVLGASDINIVVTAPHMALSTLQLTARNFPGLRLLGTLTMPVRCRWLWGYLAVALGLRTLESLGDAFTESVVFSPPSPEKARAHGAMVLVAEDNPTNQMVIARVLSRMGIAHEIAEDGEVALAMLSEQPFHLLLSDFHMPLMDGFELTRRIRAQEAVQGTPKLPIVALTADVLPETAEQCRRVGMDGYLRKPIELERLEDILRTFIPSAFEIRQVAANDIAEADAPSAAAIADPAPRELLAGIDRDIFDPDQLRDAFDDFDWDAVAFVLSFLDTVKPEIEEINRAFASQDYKNVRHRAHAMKGALLSTGAHRLGRLMKDIQDAVDDDDPDTAEIYREGLMETYEELEAALAPLRTHNKERNA